MCVLYAVTAVTNLTNSDGTTIAATVSPQSRLRAAPAFAAPSSAPPYGNGTRIESPRAPGMPVTIGAQFALTVKSVGNVSATPATLFLIAQYVAPRLKYGIAVTFATPISTPPCGAVAASTALSIE